MGFIPGQTAINAEGVSSNGDMESQRPKIAKFGIIIPRIINLVRFIGFSADNYICFPIQKMKQR